ncbi:PREDICTED: uncharacterized protein LOC104601331 [Nelumbo nucifera]|uniref:Uncharacterized protein LOC104601331 n=1 Tax=Nelumbo nucifera TaxID=4432 RepID=A0A1U8A6N5_NELNU|nr:PREDICTED: uncharacterized protein LOC104601331 [Nelumbo nucifera]
MWCGELGSNPAVTSSGGQRKWAKRQNGVEELWIVEPQAVCTRIPKRTKRRAKILSLLPKAEEEPVSEVVTLQSQVSGLTTVELNVSMHCKACAEQLKRKILKMRGAWVYAHITLQGANSGDRVEHKKGDRLTVTGTMDADHLVDYIYRRTKKQAQIVSQPEAHVSEKKEEGEKPAEEAAAKADEKRQRVATGRKKENNGNKEGKEESEGGGGGENRFRVLCNGRVKPPIVFDHVVYPNVNG